MDTLNRLISIGQRSGKLVSGSFAVTRNLNGGKVSLLLIANDAAEQSARKLQKLANFRGIPVVYYSFKGDLGRLIGKSPRTALAITDKNLARGFLEAFERGEVNRTEPKTWR